MPSVDTDKIIHALNARFAAPLPEFYKRRIIFWYDEEREFEDKLDEIVLDNAKIVALTGTNTFAVKKLLCLEDTSSNYLVYFPLKVYQKRPIYWLFDSGRKNGFKCLNLYPQVQAGYHRPYPHGLCA